MKTYSKLLLTLLICLLVISTLAISSAFADGPTWTPGQQSTATIKAVSKYRHLFNPGKPGWDGFVGKCEGGYECPGVTWDMNPAPYAATNHVTLTYDGTNTFTAVIDPDGAAGPFTRVYAAATAPGDLNYLQLDLRGQVAPGPVDEIVSFNNGELDGNSLGNATGTTGWSHWYITGVDLSDGFILEGDMVLTWPLSNTGCDECNKLVLKVGYFVPPNQPPDCSGALPSVDHLWPPEHQMVPVNVLGVTDPDGDPVTITIASIDQDEPVDETGDGAFAPDGMGVGTSTAEVRAERDGAGNGRVYHIGFTADDGKGGTCSGEVLVNVPKSQGKNGAAVDDGALYDSTVP